jgi:DNA-binding CsgD family transcriptional regulator
MARETDLIAVIYDASVEPSGWKEVIKRVAEATKSISGALGIRLHAAEHALAQHNIDPVYVNAFVQFWYKDDGLSPLIASLAPGELRAGTHITHADSFRASAFFNEFLRPQGVASLVCVGLLRTPRALEYLALQRSPAAICMEPEQWKLLETLAPHLKRAAAIQDLLARTAATTHSLGAVVAASGFAVFLLTGDCRVVFANAKAEDLVRRGLGLRYERGQLAAANPALTHRLHALAREAVRPALAEGDIGGTIEFSCGENHPKLLPHVFPLAAHRAASIFDFDRPAVAVLVVDPTADFGAQIQHFGARFGLTPAETRMLGEIIGGEGLQAAAQRLKISPATARSHADRIFAKTEIHRQAELIRRFFETSLPSSPLGG